jgi:hypothetical protein
MDRYGASLPPIIPGVAAAAAAEKPAWKGPKDAPLTESQQHLIQGKFNVSPASEAARRTNNRLDAAVNVNAEQQDSAPLQDSASHEPGQDEPSKN